MFSVSALVVFAVLAGQIGMYESAFLFMVAIAAMLSTGQSWKRCVIGSVLFPAASIAFLYLIFRIVLRLPTPSGLLL